MKNYLIIIVASIMLVACNANVAEEPAVAIDPIVEDQRWAGIDERIAKHEVRLGIEPDLTMSREARVSRMERVVAELRAAELRRLASQ